jgi:hypothetical protein
MPPPGGPTLADRLLEGAIDFHHHGYPEISFEAKTRFEDVDALALARAAGMAGIVLKSHIWPTVGRAYLLSRFVPGIEVIPSITLNLSVGGFNPMAVESAARQGARVVFMPTWSSAHDMQRGGMSKYLRGFLEKARDLTPERGLSAVDGSGKVLPEVAECLAVAQQFGMAICTGHMSPAESLAVARAALDTGNDRIVFSHPDSHSVGATREQVRDMAAMGALYEFCTLGMLPAFQRIHPKNALEIVGEVGARSCLLTTDFFFEWSPPAPEHLRMVIGTFLSLGLPADDIRTMVRDNPWRLLGRVPPEAAG